MDNHIYITVRSIYDTMCSILHPGKGEEQKTEHYKLVFFYSHFYVYPSVYWMNYTIVKQRNGLFYLST